MIAYLRENSAICVSECAGTHTRIIIRIMQVFLLCERIDKGLKETAYDKAYIQCITYQLLLVMAHCSVKKQKHIFQFRKQTLVCVTDMIEVKSVNNSSHCNVRLATDTNFQVKFDDLNILQHVSIIIYCATTKVKIIKRCDRITDNFTRNWYSPHVNLITYNTARALSCSVLEISPAEGMKAPGTLAENNLSLFDRDAECLVMKDVRFY